MGGPPTGPRSWRCNTKMCIGAAARALSESSTPPSLSRCRRNPRYRLPLPSTSLSLRSPFSIGGGLFPVQNHVHYQRICHWRLHFRGGSLTSRPTDHRIVFCPNPVTNETHQSILRWARRRTTLFAAREAIFARVPFDPRECSAMEENHTSEEMKRTKGRPVSMSELHFSDDDEQYHCQQ